jgi:hypothetical protein
MPTTVNGHQTQPKAKERTNDCCCGRRKVQQVPNHHHRSAGQPGDRVKVGPQDRGNFGQEEVRCRSSDRRCDYKSTGECTVVLNKLIVFTLLKFQRLT